jgi:hypothetical protein
MSEPIDLAVSVDTAPLHMELPRYPMVPPIDLGAEPEPPKILVAGFSLGDLGLKRALVEYPDGSRVPFLGFFLQSQDQTLAAAIAKTIGSGKLVNDAGEELILPDITGAEALRISLSRR